MLQLASLDKLLTYQNSNVINQFCKEHPSYSTQDARQLFQDLLAWLWLTARRLDKQRVTHLFGPLLKLDHMWHVFILHTRDYMEFCHTYFSSYLHHEVGPNGQEHELSSEELAEFLEDCYDHLGEDWLKRNFDL